jgi:hypothetical protein
MSGESQFRFNNNVIYPGKTLFDTTNFDIGLKYGFREFEDRYEVFGFSPSPLVKFRELEGAFILEKSSLINPIVEKKQSPFSFGVSAGFFYAPSINKGVFGVGPSLTYTITRWPFSRDK